MAIVRCLGCGCTQDNACPGGCSWVKADFPLCSKCSGGPEDVIATANAIRKVKKENGVSESSMKLMTALLSALTARARVRMRSRRNV